MEVIAVAMATENKQLKENQRSKKQKAKSKKQKAKR
jgi:hypothetical protein